MKKEPEITIDDFMKVDIRVGKVVRAEPFPEARKPSCRLRIDFGPDFGERRSSAAIAVRYSPEALTGRLVLAVVNLPARQVGPVRSEVLVLGVLDCDDEVILVAPDRDVRPGSRLH
ncbi:MAG: tRNA-binding protein [Rhodobacteraceae bacterium]|nr:tRNA-binding protein [Paracoccaceae bacterium]